MVQDLRDVIPDVRDGLTRQERVVLKILHDTQREKGRPERADGDALGPRL